MSCAEEGSGGGGASGAALGPDERARGRALYDQHCLVCHQPDGSGVPRLQPSLVDSEMVASDGDAVIRIVLRGVRFGPDALPGSEEYTGFMNSFGHLPDEDLAALISFVRMEWGDAEQGVSVEDIARVRAESGR